MLILKHQGNSGMQCFNITVKVIPRVLDVV